MNNTLYVKAGAILLILLTIIAKDQPIHTADSVSQGDLVIMPRRVLLDNAKRTQELNIANTGTDSAKYLISVVQYKMLESGAFQEITEPEAGQNFATKNFRFFPRSVTLGPNESQTVKIQSINTGELPAGEYRSHLYFRAVPEEAVVDETTKVPKSLSVQLTPTFGIAIPVIIRTGTTSLTVKMDKPILSVNDKGGPQLELTFNRAGNISVYGDVKVEHISEKGKVTQVGIAKGLAVYTPNLKRKLLLPLEKNTGVDYHKGKLKITYLTSVETNPEVITSTQIDLI